MIPLMSISSDIDVVYRKALMNVMRGDLVSPRGMKTREILAHTVVLEDVTRNVLISPERDLNYRFMVAEWLWILFGMDDAPSIIQYNKNIAKFSDDGKKFAGAYGPRWLMQAYWLQRTLTFDHDTRQAVIAIWSPNPSLSRDIPCTLTWQFLLRKGVMHMIVNMRSSDGWLGLPYDMFNFSMMCNYVAGLCGVRPGSLTMHLASSHLYEEHWDKVTELIGSVTDTVSSPVLRGPAPGTLKAILRHPDTANVEAIPNDALPQPWRLFARALAQKTKHAALEVLREHEEGGD